ncbi:MAG: hypothetical protein EOO44_13700 [Flavobacterium sp.]|nr:MAG: hypothetical protein EOO44_13700 [Flavobacterium sp.]
METKQNESITNLLEMMSNVNYFTKLQPENQNDNSFYSTLKVPCYNELNQIVSSILKMSINVLKDSASQTEIDVMLLLEVALQLLPNDEMEVLDELHKLHLLHH